MCRTLADIFGHFVERYLVVARPVHIHKRMPDNGPQPTPHRSAAAVGGKLGHTLAVDNTGPVQFAVNPIDDLFGIGLGLGQVSGHALHIRAVVVVKLPPGTFIAVRARQCQEQVIGLDQFDKFAHVRLGGRFVGGVDQIFSRGLFQRGSKPLDRHAEIRGVFAATFEQLGGDEIEDLLEDVVHCGKTTERITPLL